MALWRRRRRRLQMECDAALNRTCFFVSPSHRRHHPVVLWNAASVLWWILAFHVEAAAARRIQLKSLCFRFKSNNRRFVFQIQSGSLMCLISATVPGMIPCLVVAPLTAVKRRLSVTEVPRRDVSFEINSRPESCFTSFLCSDDDPTPTRR